MSLNLNQLLQKGIENQASDVHICVGLPPMYRINGEVERLGDSPLTPQDCVSLAKQCLNQRMYEKFMEMGEVDYAYSIPGICRFRVNVFRQRGTCAIAFRIIPTKPPKFESLGLPPIIKTFTEKRRGLVLVTGPTGSGKSTTLAALVDLMNTTKKHHIITVEDPIEYTFSHNKCLINQREVGNDSMSFSNCLRAALREDPDVIMVGEMRDQETIATTLTAAETGHLVFSTLHTVGAAKTIDRIIDVFPPHQQSQIRVQLSTILIGIVSQQLIKRQDKHGRVVATEVMVWTPAIGNLIRDSRTTQIPSFIQTGTNLGMHTMDMALSDLYNRNVIDFVSACSYSDDPENLKKLITISE